MRGKKSPPFKRFIKLVLVIYLDFPLSTPPSSFPLIHFLGLCCCCRWTLGFVWAKASTRPLSYILCLGSRDQGIIIKIGAASFKGLGMKPYSNLQNWWLLLQLLLLDYLNLLWQIPAATTAAPHPPRVCLSWLNVVHYGFSILVLFNCLLAGFLCSHPEGSGRVGTL